MVKFSPGLSREKTLGRKEGRENKVILREEGRENNKELR